MTETSLVVYDANEPMPTALAAHKFLAAKSVFVIPHNCESPDLSRFIIILLPRRESQLHRRCFYALPKIEKTNRFPAFTPLQNITSLAAEKLVTLNKPRGLS
jgi:hypothetical protein